MRYLSSAETAVAMPPLSEQLEIADAALVAIVGEAEVPGKVAIHPRPDSSIAYAMPANLTRPVAGIQPVFGMKWVTVFPSNISLALPSISGLILLCDPETAATTAIIEATAITAARTAAVSGAIFRRLAAPTDGRPPRAGLIGAGVQGRSHVPMLGHVAPGIELRIHDREPRRAEELAAAARRTEGIGAVKVVGHAAAAAERADVLVTAASFGPNRQLLQPDLLPPEVLFIAVDYEMHASAALARSASVFLVDELGGYENSRSEGRFVDFPEPTSTLGAFFVSGAPRPAGRVLAVHLGMGLTDLMFAASIARRAAERGLGIDLPDPQRLP